MQEFVAAACYGGAREKAALFYNDVRGTPKDGQAVASARRLCLHGAYTCSNSLFFVQGAK